MVSGIDVILIAGFSFVAGVIVNFLIWKYAKKEERSDSSSLENKVIKLENETKGLYENLGSLQTLLSSKDKDLYALTQHSMELEAKLQREEENNRHILSMKKSSEIRTGHIAEQLAPFLIGFNHDPRNIRYLGQPVDYVIFNKDNVTFLEVKSGKSHLSHNQKHIKRLVQEGKVRWEEFRVKGSREWKKYKKNNGNG